MTRHVLSVGLLAVAACLAPVCQAATLDAFVTDEAGKPLADAVVVATPSGDTAGRSAGGKTSDVAQQGRQFMPYVRAVQAGTAVSFPNRDDVRHHVYSFSPAKVFELKLYRGTPEKPIVFDKPGVVTLGCNIHDWMLGYIYVTDSPYFGVSGADGHVNMSNLPAGAYVVRAWHPASIASEADSQRGIDVARDTNQELAFKLKIKPELNRVRRAPTSSGGGYR